jgi:hypothetical protein
LFGGNREDASEGVGAAVEAGNRGGLMGSGKLLGRGAPTYWAWLDGWRGVCTVLRSNCVR